MTKCCKILTWQNEGGGRRGPKLGSNAALLDLFAVRPNADYIIYYNVV